MWTKGLDPRRIATTCRVPYRKVYDHIRTRVNHNPALFGQRLMLHDHPQLPPGGLGNRKPSWEERAGVLAEFRRAHERFPRGYVEEESSLYSFLQHQRNRYRAGKLSASRKAALDKKVPGWLTPPKTEREQSLWQQRVTELGDFLRETGRYPSYKKATDPLEKVLAVWFQGQRHCRRTGKLALWREQQLDAAVPGWFGSGLSGSIREDRHL